MSTLRGPLTRSTVHTEFFPLAAHPSLTLSFRELVLWAFQLIVSAVSLQLICLLFFCFVHAEEVANSTELGD